MGATWQLLRGGTHISSGTVSNTSGRIEGLRIPANETNKDITYTFVIKDSDDSSCTGSTKIIAKACGGSGEKCDLINFDIQTPSLTFESNETSSSPKIVGFITGGETITVVNTEITTGVNYFSAITQSSNTIKVATKGPNSTATDYNGSVKVTIKVQSTNETCTKYLSIVQHGRGSQEPCDCSNFYHGGVSTLTIPPDGGSVDIKGSNVSACGDNVYLDGNSLPSGLTARWKSSPGGGTATEDGYYVVEVTGTKNNTGSVRRGSIYLLNTDSTPSPDNTCVTYTVVQEASTDTCNCNSLDSGIPASVSFGPSSSSVTYNIYTSHVDDCKNTIKYEISSGSEWISAYWVTSTSAQKTGRLSVSVVALPSGTSTRTGYIKIKNGDNEPPCRTITIKQTNGGSTCACGNISIDDVFFGYNETEEASVNVTAPGGCITSASAGDTDHFLLFADATSIIITPRDTNTSTTDYVDTVTVDFTLSNGSICTKTFVATQYRLCGCATEINTPSSISFGYNDTLPAIGTYESCISTISLVSSSVNWITGLTTSGNSIRLKVEQNTDTASRIGTVEIRGTNENGDSCRKSVVVIQRAQGKSSDYLTFTATDSGTFKFNGNSISYSLDNGSTWTSLASNTNSPTVSAGQKIMWKATELTPTSSSGIGTFSSTAKFTVEGNVMSLYYGDNFAGQTDLTEKDYAFKNLFSGCTGLTSAEYLSLPATVLSERCYNDMFRDCRNLITPPNLPATTLAKQCYWCMFYNCENLTTAPVLSATTLATGCYQHMFNGCRSLTVAPELPATTLMDNCYWSAFQGCNSLVVAPQLPATMLTKNCYQDMFNSCNSLNYITCLATNNSASYSTWYWLVNVSPTGTFVKNAGMSGWSRGINGIPEGWVIQNA